MPNSMQNDSPSINNYFSSGACDYQQILRNWKVSAAAQLACVAELWGHGTAELCSVLGTHR